MNPTNQLISDKDTLVARHSIIRGSDLPETAGRFSAGRLIVITGPSGVGKGTVTGNIIQRVDNIAKSVSVTTRAIRDGEQEGVDYFFRSVEQFQSMVENGEFLESAQFAGHFYGTPEDWVEDKVAQGMDVILEIEVQGARQVREKCPNAVLVFLSPPNFEALEERLKGRGKDTKEMIMVRLEKAREELACLDLFEYEVINDNLDEAVRNLEHIVYAERLRIRPSKQGGEPKV
ncbi:MAG: guanylate kinase [Candidatus Obscuribacterales bacterium]|nr:guanylate kinase [Candidatus Obscuribacterales bacterium]